MTSAYATAVCTDAQGRRVDDDDCESGGSYRYYYLRPGAPIPYYGDVVSGRRYAAYGSYTPTAGTYYDHAPASTRMTRSAAVARGGLGSSGRSFGFRGG